MIQLKEITSKEAEKLNSERSTSYWATPIAFTFFLFLFTLIFNWLLDVPWSIFWWTSGGLFALFVIVRLINGKPTQIQEGTLKIIRQGKVIDLENKGNRPVPGNLNLGRHTDITLEHVSTPSGCPQRDTFTINQTFGMSYYKQGSSPKYRKEYLIGTQVEIEYLAESGTVIAYRELNPAANPPTVNTQFGYIELSGEKPSLPQSRVDFITLASDNYGNPGIFLRSDSITDELFVPQFALKLHRLEEWLFTLEGFNKEQYTQLKENPPAEAMPMWERRIKLGVSYRSVYAGERVSFLLGSINVYRNNGHDESIRIKYVDYISIESFCKDKPNTEFSISLRSFQHNGFSLSSRADNFTTLEKWMKRLPNFDWDRYLALKATVGEDTATLWLRPVKGNARILGSKVKSQTIKDSLKRGIYLENLAKWLDWGSFGDFHRIGLKRNLSLQKTRYPNPNAKGLTYTIKNPIILGGLEIESLVTETPYWKEGESFNPYWPVTCYRADVSFGKGGLADYETLLQHFSQFLGDPNPSVDPSDNRDDYQSASWQLDRVHMKLSIWKPYQLDSFQHTCRLEINYEPNTDHFYTDSYTQELSLHDQLRYLVLDGVLSIPFDYAHYPNSRYLPECLSASIQAEEQGLVWVDAQSEKLGIGNKQHAQIVNLNDISGLILSGMYWRDKPRELTLHFLTNKQKGLVADPSNYLGALDTKNDDSTWPLICEQLEDFTGIPCTYVEDRQYY